MINEDKIGFHLWLRDKDKNKGQMRILVSRKTGKFEFYTHAYSRYDNISDTHVDNGSGECKKLKNKF
jgi:hypothetical protein